MINHILREYVELGNFEPASDEDVRLTMVRFDSDINMQKLTIMRTDSGAVTNLDLALYDDLYLYRIWSETLIIEELSGMKTLQIAPRVIKAGNYYLLARVKDNATFTCDGVRLEATAAQFADGTGGLIQYTGGYYVGTGEDMPTVLQYEHINGFNDYNLPLIRIN